MQFKDYYKVMGVARDATQDDIKRAYRRLARKYHPDVSKESDAEARFKEVGEANEVLKDPEKRAAYDQLGADWKAGQDFRPPPEWAQGFEFSGAGFEDAGQFSDFFESLFGHVRRGPQTGDPRAAHIRMRGQDHRARVLISLEDAYRGATRSMTLQTPELTDDGHVAMATHTVSVQIPKGVTENQRLRLAGQGGPGDPRGDLYLEIGFEPHRLYRAEERDITIEIPVTPWEAALGHRIKIPTLGGTVEVKIPPGSQSGSKLRLKGRGLPGPAAGDQYAVLRIVAPIATTDKAKSLYEAMAKEMPLNPREELGVVS